MEILSSDISRNFNWDDIYDAERKTLDLAQRDLRTIPAEIVQAFGSCVEHIDLSQNRISDLEWIYDFVSLREIILDSNRLCEVHLRRLARPLDHVKVLMLNKNEFGDLNETIKHISRLFPNLEHLSLHGNALCPDGLGLRPFSEYVEYDSTFYRSYILTALPNLKFLDHFSARPNEFYDINLSKNELDFTEMPSQTWKKLSEYFKCFYRNIIMMFSKKFNKDSRPEKSIIVDEDL